MSNRLEQELKPLLDPLYRYALALTVSQSQAHDLVQETVVKVMRHRSQFEQMIHKKAWLFKVLTNLYRDSVRQQRRRPEFGPLTFEPTSNENNPMDILASREQCEQIFALFQKLGNVQRQVMYLKCVEGFSIRQIAESISTTDNNVKANLSIARKKISKLMQMSDERVVD